jgi:hypothetical protein
MPTPPFKLNRETCPPGLLAVADLAERIPERAQDLFEVEHDRRELDLFRLEVEEKKVSWHPWSTIQLIIIAGFSAFSIAWGGGLMLDFLKTYETTISKANSITTAIPGVSIPSLSTFVPPSLTSGLLSLPHIGIAEAMYVALAIILIIALIKGLIILANWKQITLLKETVRRIHEEMAALADWMTEVETPAKKNRDTK